MLHAASFNLPNLRNLTNDPNQVTKANRSPKRYFSSLNPVDVPDPTSLTKRTCCLPVSGQTADCSPANREQLGGKGMFLQRMEEAGLSVPPFKCVTARVMNALERHPLDTHRLARYLPGIDHQWLGAETSLTNIKEYLSTLPPSEQTKRDNWLLGLTQFIASDDYYEQVKDSEAAQHIRDLRQKLNRSSKSQPVIVRSSGINEDNYGDAQAGKYLSAVQKEDDVLRTCLEVMASGYRPELCPDGIPQPMALIIQHCIDCQCGGVGMSFRSFWDNTIMFEFTPGQPKGAVAGQSGNIPHRIDIFREDRKKEAGSSQYFPGTISSHFILDKKNNGYSEIRIDCADVQSNDGGQRLTNKMVTKIRKAVTKLENLLLCPVDVEFAIDRKGRLWLLQVRPVTRLSGDMVFAMPIPESKETLAIGESISEGFCTGPLWLAARQEADAMPKGAIVVADHAEEWMLEPKFLKRAGGVVLAKAGFNDHVAILLKQEKITLMRAGEQFAALAAQNGQQATLACARFNGEPGAFIVAGDLTGKLASHRSLATAFSDAPLTEAVPSRDDLTPPEGTFLQVASAFQWLSDQNARLLAFFAPGGGLDCLANPVKLSMSPQRSELLAKTLDSVIRLVGGAEALLDGYGAFLSLAGNGDQSQLKPQREELQQLINRFEMLKQTIQPVLKRIILPMQAAEKGQAYRGDFRQWVADCQQLQSCLQALEPRKAKLVRSVHELIFALHQRFVKALAPVILESGQGRLSEEWVKFRLCFKKCITFVDCTTPGKSGEKAPLLSPSVKESIRQLAHETIVISMDEVLIVNLKLGGHQGLVELLENAEGGKGRTLRLKFSDDFDAAFSDGKYQRVWFLAQLLKAIKLDEKAAGIKLACNPVARELIVECPGMKTREDMQAAFEKLMIVLDAMFALDIAFDKAVILEESPWDFNLLAQRLNPDVTIETDAFNFQHCLFSIPYLKIDGLTISPACCQLLSDHLQQVVHHAERLGELRELVVRGKKPEVSLREIIGGDEMSEDIRRELIHHLLLSKTLDPIPPFEDFYDRFKDEYYILKPTRDYKLTFAVPPSQSLTDSKEEVSKALVKDGLKYASQRIRGDKELVIAAIKLHKDQHKYMSKELEDDKDVAIALVTNYEYHLRHLSPKFQDDFDVVRAAVAEYPRSLRFASERFRNDKDIIKELVAINISCLMDVNETLLSDREYMLDLITEHPGAIEFADLELIDDQLFIDSAKLRNPRVIRYIGGILENVGLTLSTLVDENRCVIL
ncbi:PEP/pyruvate-binding domain-containing protein [Endozoicomonas sp. 8E]|uniref:PEP/pyruvate-binding domain-containing protein n=1 Tax=Endozoicomonas sp. 8E TaxID=3035692 RepID=UPI002939344A|nr:DUF4116 domain-containing protein [Endozoicomonas sp. 8E]WOG25680.1 PEP/pyruvate-binding domain-containing protein [Endozoicomonas sp. 8E]